MVSGYYVKRAEEQKKGIIITVVSRVSEIRKIRNFSFFVLFTAQALSASVESRSESKQRQSCGLQ